MSHEPRKCKSGLHSLFVSISIIFTFLIVVAVFIFTNFIDIKNQVHQYLASVSNSVEITALVKDPEIKKPAVTHIPTPEQVKGVYMSSWVAGTPHIRNRVIDVIDTTEVNTVVIDIKDATGKISFIPEDADLQAIGCTEPRIKDIKSFIEELHKKNIYVIGRVSVFQDPCYVQKRPDLAVKTLDRSQIWKDEKGISWVDAGAKEAWDYNVKIARASYDRGFDEINFDYIRFPSDGNMRNISFSHSGTTSKSLILKEFFQYLDQHLHTKLAHASSTAVQAEAFSSPSYNIPISADLFGMVTTSTDDLGIGQILEYTLPYVDFVSPMVYPSHYPPKWRGFDNPAARPYEVIQISMQRAVERAIAMGQNPKKLRPWLQDFNLGAIYTASMVRDQIKATYDVGLDSWLIWSPSNKYTKGAYLTQ